MENTSLSRKSKSRPSVFNLPLNPMANKSYKCNFIKARVDYKQSSNTNKEVFFVPANLADAKNKKPKNFVSKQNAYVKN